MSLLVDVMHLVVILAGVAMGAWSLIGLRRSLPRGRFAVFGVASAGALFGCAALAGEIGLIPPAAWFAVVLAAMIAALGIAMRTNRSSPRRA